MDGEDSDKGNRPPILSGPICFLYIDFLEINGEVQRRYIEEVKGEEYKLDM